MKICFCSLRSHIFVQEWKSKAVVPPWHQLLTVQVLLEVGKFNRNDPLTFNSQSIPSAVICGFVTME